MKIQLHKTRIAWPLISTACCFVWSIIFWAAFFVGLSWNVLHIPMGQAGAIYPVFFWPFVLIGSLVYEFIIGFFVKPAGISTLRQLTLTLWLPFIVIAILLIVFCPMDTQQSYLSYLFSLLHK